MKNTRQISIEHKRKLVKLKRKHHHPLVHKLHKKHKISYKTLHYMREYGPKSNVYHVIIKESIKVLILASILSSVGGFGLQSIQSKITSILPLLILLPALNNMIGSYGTIVSSKFTTMLYLGKAKKQWWKSSDVRTLFSNIFLIAVMSSVFIGLLASGVSYTKGFGIGVDMIIKIIEISLISTLVMVFVIFILSTTIGLYIYRKNEDPNNFLIPITTSVGDLGSMAIFSFMVYLFF